MRGLLKNGRIGGIKTILPFRQSHPSRKVSNSESKEYDCGMKAINVMGLEPTVVSECSMCQQLLSDLGNGNGDRIKHHHIDINEDKPNETFQALWVVKNDGPGHLKAHTLQV